MSEFVRASRLYDVENRSPIAHPAHQASDADVRRALEDREVRADGGSDSSSSCSYAFCYSSDPPKISSFPITRIERFLQEQEFPSLAGRTSPFGEAHTVNTASHFSHVPSAISISSSLGVITHTTPLKRNKRWTTIKYNGVIWTIHPLEIAVGYRFSSSEQHTQRQGGGRDR